MGLVGLVDLLGLVGESRYVCRSCGSSESGGFGLSCEFHGSSGPADNDDNDNENDNTVTMTLLMPVLVQHCNIVNACLSLLECNIAILLTLMNITLCPTCPLVKWSAQLPRGDALAPI